MADDFGALLADVSAPANLNDGTTSLNTDQTTDDSGAVVTTQDQGDKTDASQQNDADQNQDQNKDDQGDKSDKGADDKPLSPSKVQAALKALRESGGENAKIAGHLKDVYGRYQGYTKVFPKVADAQLAKTTLDAVGGREGLSKIQETVANVNATDAALYAGKKEVIQNLYEDCVANQHPEAFGKLAPHFLDTLEAKDAAAYEAAMAPRHLKFLDSVAFPNVVNSLGKALQAKDTEAALSIVKEMARFYNDFKDGIKQPAAKPEQEAWEKEKEEFHNNQKQEFNNSVGKSALETNNKAIIDALKPYFKGNPYFKNWTSRMVNNLGGDIQRELVSQLKKDGDYQAQMKALWSVAKPNRDEILRYHKSVVDLKVAQVTKEVLDKDYTGYARLGNVVTTNTDKDKGKGKGGDKNTDRTSQTTTVFVSAEPKRDEIDWAKDPNGLLYTTDKAYLKKTGQLVSWAKKR